MSFCTAVGRGLRRLGGLVSFLIVVTAVIVVMNEFHLFDAGDGRDLIAIDGDSLRGPQGDIRLLGLDAPELSQDCLDAQKRSFACGLKARDTLRSLITGRNLSCLSTERDVYDRALSICKVEGVDIGLEMVRSGWAIAFLSPRYQEAEDEARRTSTGLWAGSFDQPADYRAAQRKNRLSP